MDGSALGIISLLVSVALSVVLFLLHRQYEASRRELDQMKKDTDEAVKGANAAAAELARHKLYAAETFAKRTEVVDAIDRAERRIKEQMAEDKERILERLGDILVRVGGPKH